MTYGPDRNDEPIELSEEDRKVLQEVAEDVTSSLQKMASFRTRFGAARPRKIGVVIVQDPDNPDTVQICTDVVTGDGPFEISCWCEPPGVCTVGPCSGGTV